jgi:NitT/TauT family transport system substrate-binding protein
LSIKLQTSRVGRVVLDSNVDRPWSNYYCCMAASNGDWFRRHPVAAKRALRALLRGADATHEHPPRAARALVDRGFATDLKHTQRNLEELPYDVWRRFDPADTIRFYALRMKEAGLVAATPAELLDRGCDFGPLEQLRREL